MTKKTSIWCFIAVLALILFVFIYPPRASAQILDGAIFELNLSFKGNLFLPDGSSSRKEAAKATGYMIISYDSFDGAFYSYDYTFWMENDIAGWVPTSTGTLRTLAAEDLGMVDMGGITFSYATQAYYCYVNGIVKIKATSGGDLRRATFKAVGINVVISSIAGTGVGGGKLTGRTIDSSQLPFTP